MRDNTNHFRPKPYTRGLLHVFPYLAQLERRELYRGVIISVTDLKVVLEHFIKAHNAESEKPFIWTKPADQILVSGELAKNRYRINRMSH